jgi:diguanylate cyclase (GGDEF)-like protein/PAS domain S-box-containing protein
MQRRYLTRLYQNLWLSLGLFVVLALLFGIYVYSEKQIDRAYERRDLAFLLANELRQSSADLTMKVRTYVATGNPLYKKHFQEILDIRDGKQPRPIDYKYIYWDLVLADDQRPTPSGQAISLLDLFRQVGFTEAEFAKLAEAKRSSDELTQTEFKAMSLIEPGASLQENRETAIRMLFDDAYFQAKAKIMRPIREFYQLVDKRTLSSIRHAEDVALLLRYAFIAFSVFWTWTLYRSYRVLTDVLGGSVKQLYQSITKLGQGEFFDPITVSSGHRDSVLAWLSETQKNLARLDNDRRITEANNQRLTRFYAVLSQCNQAIVRSTSQEQLFEVICRDTVVFGGLKMVWIGLIEPNGYQLKPVASYGLGTEYLDDIDITTDASLASGRGPTGTALREDRAFWCHDFQKDSGTSYWRERAEPYGWGASASLPLHRNGRVIGGFTLYGADTNAFGEEERKLLLELAADIDFALTNFEHENQRKANERALMESHALLRTIIDTVPVRIFWKDKGSCYLGCNILFARDAGVRSEQDILGKDDFQLCWQEQAALYQVDDQNVMVTGKPKLGFEELQTTPQGHQMWLRTSKVPLRDTQQLVIGMIGVYEDITAQKKNEEHLRLAASVFDHSNEAILVTDSACNIIDVNRAFTRITGYEKNEVLGKNPNLLRSGLHEADFYAEMWQSIHVTGQWTGEIWNRNKQGEHYAELLSINCVKNEAGAVEYYVALFSDITAIKDHQKQLEYLAHYDPLTHLPNRVLLTDRLQQALAHADRYAHTVSLIYIDLDGFKEINDRYGHACGDQLLVHIADSMKHALRHCDTLARLGGDEFVVVLPELNDIAMCQEIIDRLLIAATKPFCINGLRLRISASIGVACYPQYDKIEPDQLIRQADQAMYQAKLAGKSRYCFFDADHDLLLRKHHQSLERIRLALQNHEFLLHYQPKINLRTHRVIGVEGLIRWLDPEKGIVYPNEFLPFIGKHSLHIELGNWVLYCALDQLRQWRNAGIELPISINIDGAYLQNPNFLNDIRNALRRYPDINPAHLELEVLESSALNDIVGVSSVIEACKTMGIRFALDDFGTGYSSLTYLKRLPVRTLKIDQSFVRDMLEDQDDLAILSGVIGLARAFGRECIAEGVETDAHAEKLLEMGCEFGQGYAFAKPMSAESLVEWLDQRSKFILSSS